MIDARRPSALPVLETLEDRVLLAVTGTAMSHAMSIMEQQITWLQSGSVNGVIAKGTYTQHGHHETTDQNGLHVSDSLTEPWTEGENPGWQGLAFPLAADSHNATYVTNGGAYPTAAMSSAFIDYLVSVRQIAPLPAGFTFATFYVPVRSQFGIHADIVGSPPATFAAGTADAYVETCLSNGAEYTKQQVQVDWANDKGTADGNGRVSRELTPIFTNNVAYSPLTHGSDYISIHFTAAGSSQVGALNTLNVSLDSTAWANVQDIDFDQAAFDATWGIKSFNLSSYFELVYGWDPSVPVPAGPGHIDLAGTLTPLILPTPTRAGDFHLVQLAVQNTGNGVASGFSTMQLWASGDGVLGGADDFKLSEIRPYVYIPPSGTGYCFFSYLAPSGIPAGTYDLVAVIDSGNDIPETSKANNQVAIVDRVVMQVPDLRGATPTALNPIIMPATNSPGGYNLVELRVQNAGAVTASGFATMQLWASMDGNLSAGTDDYKLSEVRPYIYIPAGGTGYVYFSYTAPANIPAGTYDLIAVIDSANDITESNEANNQPGIVDRFVMLNPDLAPAAGAPINPIVMGATSRRWDFQFVEVRVQNAGAALASGFVSMQLWASLDGTLGAGDYKLAEIRPYLYIPPGSTGSVYFVYFVPPTGLANGSYNLIAVIDSGNDLLETNEGNNQCLLGGRFALVS